jgi:hypothetical protein
MATSGTHGLQRSSISSERARRTVKAIEAQIGTTISSNTSNHTPSETAPIEQQLEFDFTRSVDET